MAADYPLAKTVLSDLKKLRPTPQLLKLCQTKTRTKSRSTIPPHPIKACRPMPLIRAIARWAARAKALSQHPLQQPTAAIHPAITQRS